MKHSTTGSGVQSDLNGRELAFYMQSFPGPQNLQWVKSVSMDSDLVLMSINRAVSRQISFGDTMDVFKSKKSGQI